MTSRVEAEGSSIDEAIERALGELGVSREEARVEILQDAKRGLFGLGGQKARVAVTRRTRGALETGDEAPSAPAEPPRRAPEARPRETPPAERRAAPPAAAPVRPRAPEGRAAAAPGEPVAADEAASVLGRILAHMDVEATVDAGPAQVDGQPTLRIATAHGALVIGRHGQTLDALEYLVNRIIGKQEERGTRIVVDCEDYRERHRRELEEAANRMAEKVRSRGKSQTMTPMSPRDRRIVHVALSGQDDVVTRSVGQGYLRRIVIAPARGNRSPAPRP